MHESPRLVRVAVELIAGKLIATSLVALAVIYVGEGWGVKARFRHRNRRARVGDGVRSDPSLCYKRTDQYEETGYRAEGVIQAASSLGRAKCFVHSRTQGDTSSLSNNMSNRPLKSKLDVSLGATACYRRA